MSTSIITLPNISSYTEEVFQFRAETSPHYSEVEPASYAWFDSYGIYANDKRQKFIDAKFGLMAALCFPSVVDVSHFRTTTDTLLWHYSFQGMVDDNTFSNPEEMRSAIDAIMRAVNDPGAPSFNFQPAAMIQSCIRQIAKDAAPLTTKRIVAGLDKHLHACFEAKFNRITIPTLEEYMELRRGTSATQFWSSVCQYARGLDLPDQVADHPSLSDLTGVVLDIYNILCDIYSVNQVVQKIGSHRHNILSVLMHHNSLDLQGAIDFAYRLIQGRLDTYKDNKAKLPSFGSGLDDQVARLFQTFEQGLLGQSEWAFITSLYFGEQAESVKRTGVVNLENVAPA